MSSLGYCPVCGADGVSRERRPFGNDKCKMGHVYPSDKSCHVTSGKNKHGATCMEFVHPDGVKEIVIGVDDENIPL